MLTQALQEALFFQAEAFSVSLTDIFIRTILSPEAQFSMVWDCYISTKVTVVNTLLKQYFRQGFPMFSAHWRRQSKTVSDVSSRGDLVTGR